MIDRSEKSNHTTLSPINHPLLLLMEKDPLLPFSSPISIQPNSLLPTLPEDDVIFIPPPSSLTRSGFKEYLIFGPPTPPSSSSPLSHPIIIDNPSHTAPNSPLASSSSISNLDQWLLDPNCPSTKNCLHKSKTAPALNVINDLDFPAVKKVKQIYSQSIVKQAVLLLMLYLTLGVVIYSCYRDNFEAPSETHPVVDALYFCIVTMCTIGYGDITPATTTTKLFAIFFVLIGFGFIDILLSGMVGYVLDLQESYLLSTMKTQGAHDPKSILIDVKKGRMRIRMKVALALGVVVLCIGIGAAFMHFVERLDWLDSFYLSVMSVTTVGYGDRAFSSTTGRIFASIWLLVSTLGVARAFLFLAEARVDKRHRMLEKFVLGQDLTVAQFLAADLDHNGCVSKSEFVIYKLKEMGKVSEKDIQLICKQFESLDAGNCGKITLADLMDHRHQQRH